MLRRVVAWRSAERDHGLKGEENFTGSLRGGAILEAVQYAFVARIFEASCRQCIEFAKRGGGGYVRHGANDFHYFRDPLFAIAQLARQRGFKIDFIREMIIA